MTSTIKQRLLPAIALLTLLAGGAHADDRIGHFSGKPADTLEQAVTNFTAGNQQLRQLLSGEVTYEDLAEIHKLSYTLENALGKLNEEMDVLTVLLEQVHLASETGKIQVVKGSSGAYFEIVDSLQLGTEANPQ